MLFLLTVALSAKLKDIMCLICGYCICYTSDSTATVDLFNVSDVKFIFKKQCNSLRVPAQILAMTTVNTCDTAVAAIAQ